MRDLLAPNGVQRAIKQSECDPSGPYAEGLSHHIVGSYETIKQMLIAGNKCRAMAANAKSTIDGKASQPWAIFTLTIRYTNGSGTTNELCRKVSFVDSGGSEGHEHLKLDSFMGINLSESSREITDNGVDQRDSLLSWLLNQFLGGKSKATIVAMIDPSAGNYQEILTALTSSVGAKPIVIQPLRPEDSENIITDSLQSKLGNEQKKSSLAENHNKQLPEDCGHMDTDEPQEEFRKHTERLSLSRERIDGLSSQNPQPEDAKNVGGIPRMSDASNIQKPRENVKVFYWDEPPDVTFLESRLKERFPMISKGMSLIPLCEMAEDEWKSEARKAKIIIFCYSMQSRKHIEDETTYLQFCIGMNDLKEMEKQSENEKNGQKTLIRKHHQIGIFSRSAESDYDWLQTSLRTELRDLVVGVSSYYISNNGWLQFLEEVSQCTFGILYHTMRRGRLNITNVTDALYDDELKYMAEILGKENVIVVADDLEDNSPEKQQRILEHQPNIGEYACDLVLLTPADKKEKVQLMEKLKTIGSALHVTSLYVHLTEEEDDDDQIKNITEEITRLVNNLPKPVEKTMKEIMQRLDCDTPDFLKKYFKQAKGRTVNIVQFFKNFDLKEKGTSESKDSWELRRLNSLTDSLMQLVPVQRAKKKHKVGIFSRSAEDDYRWLHRFILSEFSDYVQEVRPCYISNYGLMQFLEELSQCSVAILYHTKNRGRINITDVEGSLYDEELQYLAEELGKDRVMVVVDDLEDSSSDEKERILRSQGSIGKWASDLILISTAEKNFHASGKSNYKQLLLEKFNRFTKV
ncbi:hypothetical protein XELAEV_18013419mg [Xenopus laevis]|uniref:Kinesin motor domain-containing protein n=1 Tax=Xenopus laevis TaxID=8355 RepID=A0A974HZL5_XENLA|nr:hypothetical protein XELAEV_18013419mg [Xenopus laevis]